MTPLLANAIHGWWTAQKAEQEILARSEREDMLLRTVREDMSGFQAQVRTFSREWPSLVVEVEAGVFVVLAWQSRDCEHIMELATVEQLGEHEETTYVVPT